MSAHYPQQDGVCVYYPHFSILLSQPSQLHNCNKHEPQLRRRSLRTTPRTGVCPTTARRARDGRDDGSERNERDAVVNFWDHLLSHLVLRECVFVPKAFESNHEKVRQNIHDSRHPVYDRGDYLPCCANRRAQFSCIQFGLLRFSLVEH